MFLDGNHFSDSGLKNSDVSGKKLKLATMIPAAQSFDTYPLSSPPKALAIKATGRLGAKPKINMLSAVPAKPVKSTGFRPILSDNLPQATPEENSAKAKAEVTIPAYIGRSSGLLTYGKIDMKAMGSQIRHNATNINKSAASHEAVDQPRIVIC
ncbi:hypothetical protein HYFRA_00013740 [Hymenoscyphus fraxineus]|uniref:Uncharacterized protein n=1 Tax=Hymenoscyphus fraxineus TaxID=746836 RepID=A0A9N9L7Q9_9HELO|nr:hypothetical protein HYFRA_00013740 [Hymenoscyphus fraxineus]